MNPPRLASNSGQVNRLQIAGNPGQVNRLEIAGNPGQVNRLQIAGNPGPCKSDFFITQVDVRTRVASQPGLM